MALISVRYERFYFCLSELEGCRQITSVSQKRLSALWISSFHVQNNFFFVICANYIFAGSDNDIMSCGV